MIEDSVFADYLDGILPEEMMSEVISDLLYDSADAVGLNIAASGFEQQELEIE